MSEAIRILLAEIFGQTYTVDIDLARDALDIQALFKTARIKNNLRDLFPQIAAEWDYDKNRGIHPEHVSYGSHEVFMWKCPLGHPSYPASVKNRTHGKGCPVCANQAVCVGYNDFASQYPEFLHQWDYELNAADGIHPDKILATNRRTPVHWFCRKCGHRWVSKIYSRIRRSGGCPVCHDGKKKGNR